MNTLTTQQKCALRSQAHHLKPIVILGNNGFTPAVKAEMERALNDHELIKIKVNAENKEDRHDLIQQICKTCNASLIQTIGHTAAIYRKKEED
ncbi:MAG: ribosome assembly RNA-binding protein YhbY [Gammaproteobacteria bacterium]|nr:ribosome assembly RNA-binding protein YhbY [Gammaproteobacteria bacterium]